MGWQEDESRCPVQVWEAAWAFEESLWGFWRADLAILGTLRCLLLHSEPSRGWCSPHSLQPAGK